MSEPAENLARNVSTGTRLRLSRTGWRQRGFAVGRYDRVRLSVEELRVLGGDDAVSAYADGLRTGERERLRAST